MGYVVKLGEWVWREDEDRTVPPVARNRGDRITAEDKHHIRMLYYYHVPAKKIAAVYGITPAKVRKISDAFLELA